MSAPSEFESPVLLNDRLTPAHDPWPRRLFHSEMSIRILRWAQLVIVHFVGDDTLGLHLAGNIFVGTTLLWLILRRGANTTPIWAIASMVAVIDPQVNLAYQNFRGRILNTLLGCAVGLTFLLVGGSNEWKLPLSMSATVLLSSYVFKVPLNWRIAPTTAALIIASGLVQHSKMSGAEVGVRRLSEIILGCVVGISVTWVVGQIWKPPKTAK
jgi:uncharacterized membrane protein YccC